MAAREIICGGCGAKVFEVAGYFNNLLILDRGKIEIAYLVSQVAAYATQGGFKIHKCQKKENT